MDRFYARRLKQPGFRIPGSASVSSSQSIHTVNASATFITNATATPHLALPSPTDLQFRGTHTSTQSTHARRLVDSLPPNCIDARERAWIDSTIRDTEDAVHAVAVLIERLRVEQETNNGHLWLKARLSWVVSDSKRARELTERLVLCHGSLMGVLGRLQAIQNGAGSVVRNEIMDGERTRTASRYVLDLDLREERAPSPVWDLSVELQDAGMELVVPDPKIEAGEGAKTEVSFQVRPPKEAIPAPRHPTFAPSPTAGPGDHGTASTTSEKLDRELLDMLSWRWAQGQVQQ
ncbi:hypothetical protein BDW60DRAFT_202095 [Aspergillus nidulans var. acristatus]